MSVHGEGGPPGGAQPMPGNPPQPGPGPTDAELARMSREDLVTLGAKMDGVEVIYTELVEPGSSAERRAERQVAAAFTGAGLSALAFMVIFVAWPWEVETAGGGFDLSTLYTPLLGLTMGLAITLIGIGVVLWAKKLMPYEIAVQERHEGASPEIERQTTAATLIGVGNATGIARRSLIKRSLGFGATMLGLMAIFPLGGLIKKPGAALFETPWEPGMRLLTLAGLPIRPDDMRPGALQTVFPPVEGGTRSADGVAMLIRLLPQQVTDFRAREGQEDFRWNDFVAYSKICTHAGCPVSLYEQETARILCPCHQSQFDATDGAKSIFGPASRSLPQLAVEVDDDGYFVAKSDFIEPIGPAFWERSS